jgi:hypothetical protein
VGEAGVVVAGLVVTDVDAGAEVEVVATGLVTDVEVDVAGEVVVAVCELPHAVRNSPSRSIAMIPMDTVFFISFPPL